MSICCIFTSLFILRIELDILRLKHLKIIQVVGILLLVILKFYRYHCRFAYRVYCPIWITSLMVIIFFIKEIVILKKKIDKLVDRSATMQSSLEESEFRVVYSTRAMLPSAKKDSVPTTQKSCVVYEFSRGCEARYVGRTTQRLADRIKQHVPTSIRKKSNTVREQPPRLCKNNNSKINCESAIGHHLLTNPECAKTYTDDNFRIIGQGRSSFHLSVLESVYVKTQNPVLRKQKDFIFSLGIFK